MNLGKRLSLIGCSMVMLLAGSQAAAAAGAAQPATTIVLDGYPLPFPVSPEIVRGTTMVPFRAIAEALQISVSWDNKTHTITADKTSGGSKKQVLLKQNSKTAFVDGRSVQLPVAPMARSGSILVPLSFFGSQFGAKTSWDGAARTVSIVSPAAEMYTEAFYALASFDEHELIDRFDSVSFGWASIGGDGKLTVKGKDYYWPQPAGDVTPESLVTDAAKGGTAPQLMVVAKDGSGELTKLLGDASLQQQAVQDMVNLAAESGFAGITLDFEGLGLTGDKTAVQKSYNAFVRLVGSRAKAAGLKLSLALHPLNGSYQGYDYKTLAGYADELIIMAYGYSYEKGPEPLNRVDEAIRLALQQAPKNKLVLGISMGSENAQTVDAKIGLAKRYGLKGIALWRLGLIGDDAMKRIGNAVVLD
ncbi:stalk domain-containing protein [Paenibacillus humicola]|uniref:stalk domain-containing protein n=1 Tax=Paenibacillus humicola TaxID=3110540 RepID=UPI00237B8C5F|nr:stalk domain-containing protein [Paenibacillus humicola]